MSITSFVKRIQDITRNDAGVNGDAQRIEQMSWLLFLKIFFLFQIIKWYNLSPNSIRLFLVQSSSVNK